MIKSCVSKMHYWQPLYLSHQPISRLWLLVLVPIVVVKAYFLKKRKDNVGYPDPQPSALKHDLTKDKLILSPDVSNVSIQLSWARESVNMLPFSFVRENIFDLYVDGILAAAGAYTTQQLSYADIDYAARNGNNLTIYTKLKKPTAIALKSKQIDEIIQVLTSKGIRLRSNGPPRLTYK